MPGWRNPLHCFVALYVVEGSEREQCHLLGPHPAFLHFPGFPQVNCTLLGADSQMGSLVYILGCHRPIKRTLLCDWQFIPPLQYPQIFTATGLRLYFSVLEPWVAQYVSLPSCAFQFISTQVWDHPVCQLPPWHVCFPPGGLSPANLQFWMYVSSLTPWLSDFHTV